MARSDDSTLESLAWILLSTEMNVLQFVSHFNTFKFSLRGLFSVRLGGLRKTRLKVGPLSRIANCFVGFCGFLRLNKFFCLFI